MMWKTVKLGDVCDLQNGFAFKSSDYVDNSNTLNIRMSNIRPNGKFNEFHNIKYLPDDYANKYANYKLIEGDLIIAMTDMAGDPKILGMPTIIKNLDGRTFLLNQRVGKLHSFSDEIYVPYLCYFLSTLKNFFKSKGAGGLQINISKKDILSAEIPLPPLPEQERIVAKLDAVFTEIDESLINVDKAIQAAEDGLANLVDDKTKNKIEWNEYKISDLGLIQTGNTPKTSNKENFGLDMPFVKPPNFQSDGKIVPADEGLSSLGASQSRIADKNSIMMVCIGATIGKVGICLQDVCFNQQINALTPRDEFDAELIYWQMRGRRFQNEVRRKAGQATLPIISKSKWQNLSIFLPDSLIEQVKIRELLRDLNSQTEDYINHKQLKRLELSALKSAILSQELQPSEAA